MKDEIVKPLDVETCSVAISLGATPEYNIENIVNENLYLKGCFSKIHPLLRKGQVIGRGATGHVYKLIEDSKTEVEYVVKEICLPAEDSEKLSNIFYREVEVLRGLPDHHRIIQFFGYCVSEFYCSLYLAYMKLGSISAALRKGPFSEEKCFLYTGQILEGLEFLHKNGVIHRDIKGPNVLLEDENNIRITDFGLAKFIDDSDNTMELGTCRWMAPEVVNRKPDTEPYNFKADIWSVGCTALEMITAKVPYHDRSNIANIIFTLHNGESPKLPDNISERMERLLKKTFVVNHVERFSAEKLIEEFFSIESLTEKHCSIIQIQELSFYEDKEGTWHSASYTHERIQNMKGVKKDFCVYLLIVIFAIIFFPISIGTLVAIWQCKMKRHYDEGTLHNISFGGTSAPSVDVLKDWIKGNPMKNKNVYVLTDPEERDDRKFIVKENVFTEDRKFYYYVNNELLQGLKHENLISFYGYIEESNLILTFFDYMPAGSLQDLYNQQGKIQESKCFNYAEQILEGLQYLHSRRIAHMNIRCETIVFETEDKLRIAGLSHIIIGRQMISSADYGKERWTAPEVFNEAHGHGFYDYQSDIWSLGCTVVEMLTAECPYAYEKYLPSVIITIGMGIPPETGQSLSIRMKNLLQKTLCADPFKRFGAKNILKILRSVEGDIYLPVDMNPSSSKAVIPKVVCIDPQGSTTTSKGSTKLKKGIGVYEM